VDFVVASAGFALDVTLAVIFVAGFASALRAIRVFTPTAKNAMRHRIIPMPTKYFRMQDSPKTGFD
jgi:hypothetical protein